MTNEIIVPITPDGLVGFDSYKQLWVVRQDGDSTRQTPAPDVRDLTCPICRRPWEMTGAGFADQIHNRITEELMHETCYVGHLALSEAEMWYNVVCDTRGENRIPLAIKKIPNEYGGAWPTPWYRVTFEGRLPYVKLGSRKRVYHMSLHDLTHGQVAMFRELFADESSTKWDNRTDVGIHAWREADARKYMERFYQILLAGDIE